MPPEEIAILLAAQKALKEDVKELFEEFKNHHDKKAEERWAIVLNKIDMIESRYFDQLPTYIRLKDYVEKSDELDKLQDKERITFLWKIFWIPISGILTFIGWFLFDIWKKGK